MTPRAALLATWLAGAPRVRPHPRRAYLPRIVRRDDASAKEAFDRRELDTAAEGFGRMLTLLRDPDLAEAAAGPSLPDLALLSAGFHELSRSRADASPARAVPGADIVQPRP